MGSQLEKAKKYNLDENEKKRIAEEAYRVAVKEENYKSAIDIAREFLEFPEKEIHNLQEQGLYKTMITNWASDDEMDEEYLDIVNQFVEDLRDLPLERIKAVAQKAYDSMIKSEDRIPDGSVYLRAAKLANKYDLGREKVFTAVDSAVQIHQMAGGLDLIAGTAKELEVPDERIKPIVLRYYTNSLYNLGDESEKIRKKYNITEEEYRPLIKEAYESCIKDCLFKRALQLRTYYSFIQDDIVSTEDLKILTGIMKRD
jgi:hypothetical protein